MNTSITISNEMPATIGLSPLYCETHWYAVYTRAQHEKRVARVLKERGIENFLPQFRTVRKWKDRRVTLDMPLFPGYAFVQIALTAKLQILQVPGVVRLVSFCGQPYPIPAADLERLRIGLSQKLPIHPHPLLTRGCRVRLKQGPLQGLEGILVRRKNAYRVVISIGLLCSAAAVEVDEASIERIS